MNCTSAYPPKPEDVHISFISEMREKFPKAIIGHSDHTSGIETTIAAFCLGAKVFEKHVTVSHELTGPDSDVSLDFSQVKSLIQMLNNLDKSLKATKEIHQSELEIREWAHRSLVYLRELPKGHVVSDKDIWGKRPGTGVPSYRYQEFIGKTLNRDVNANTLISENDFVQD
jgi:N-acetylneuraminate synthase